MAEISVRDMPTYEGLPNFLLDALTGLLAAAGICPHYASTGETVTAADASSLATSKTLTLALVDAFVAHGLDTDIHSAADAALDVPAAAASHPAEPADLAEVGATLNELKADLNTHLANATPHRGVGGQAALTVAQISTSDFSSTQGEANTLANALKAAFNLHVAQGLPDYVID